MWLMIKDSKETAELISSQCKHFKAEVDDLSSFYMSMMIWKKQQKKKTPPLNTQMLWIVL